MYAVCLCANLSHISSIATLLPHDISMALIHHIFICFLFFCAKQLDYCVEVSIEWIPFKQKNKGEMPANADIFIAHSLIDLFLRFYCTFAASTLYGADDSNRVEWYSWTNYTLYLSSNFNQTHEKRYNNNNNSFFSFFFSLFFIFLSSPSLCARTASHVYYMSLPTIAFNVKLLLSFWMAFK